MSSSNQQQLLLDINRELTYVKRWCDINKLSINLKKTNFMIIKSSRKKLSVQFNIKLPCEGSDYILEQKDSTKYLGVTIDDKLNWNKHVSFIVSRISRNTQAWQNEILSGGLIESKKVRGLQPPSPPCYARPDTGIFFKLHHYLSPKQLCQIYCTIIYPYLSFAITAWGSSAKTNIKILQTRQNCIAIE